MALDNQFEKDPRAHLDFSVRWSDWLGTDQISSSSWAAVASNPDSAIVLDTPSTTTGTATVWVSSGTVNHTYRLENSIATLAGRTDNRSILIEIKDR